MNLYSLKVGDTKLTNAQVLIGQISNFQGEGFLNNWCVPHKTTML